MLVSSLLPHQEVAKERFVNIFGVRAPVYWDLYYVYAASLRLRYVTIMTAPVISEHMLDIVGYTYSSILYYIYIVTGSNNVHRKCTPYRLSFLPFAPCFGDEDKLDLLPGSSDTY